MLCRKRSRDDGNSRQKGRIMKTFWKALKISAIAALVLLILGGTFFAGLGFGLYYAIMPAGGNPVRFEVAKGTPAGVVARNLENAGIIRNARLFRVALYLTKAERDIKPGTYLLDPSNNMMEILNQLRKGSFKLRLVTIPEGLTLREISVLFEKSGVAKAKDIMKAADEKLFYVNGRKLDKIEGFLLPDTYDVPEEYTPADALGSMIKAFDKNVVPLYERKKDSLPYKLSLKQIVILASLVEREAQVPTERPVVAAVYYNRLKKGMRMECDATIQYALGKQKMVLKFSDLKIQSPYNTYLHQGLPPGPIANPGIECIKAVLNPASADYLFYVRNDVKNDGSHVFTKTLQEHNAAISKYQK
jgi:UPF0755 protein